MLFKEWHMLWLLVQIVGLGLMIEAVGGSGKVWTLTHLSVNDLKDMMRVTFLKFPLFLFLQCLAIVQKAFADLEAALMVIMPARWPWTLAALGLQRILIIRWWLWFLRGEVVGFLDIFWAYNNSLIIHFHSRLNWYKTWLRSSWEQCSKTRKGCSCLFKSVMF